ncbi:MAG: deoxyribonuclease IV, partial [Methanomicrobiales archaeon]|nr:deoxyribonuclease IV [Methanomicrobiales archaeon]
MVAVGCHVSIAGSVARAVDRAVERGCDVFQIFTGNPRGWAAKELAPDDAAAFRKAAGEAGLAAVAHMPYLPNLASPKATVYKRSVEVMVREMGRCAALGIPHLITHLGSHLGEGAAAGRERLSDGIARALAAGPEGVVILLENTAGTKNSMGGTFPEIRDVMDAIDDPGRIGICLDTCHAYAAGYDLASPEAVAATLDAF